MWPPSSPIGFVRPHDHREGVPAHERRKFLFDGEIAGEGGLPIARNGIDIGRDEVGRPIDVRIPRHRGELVQDETGTRRPFGLNQR